MQNMMLLNIVNFANYNKEGRVDANDVFSTGRCTDKPKYHYFSYLHPCVIFFPPWKHGIKSRGISDIIWLVVTTVLAVQFIGFIVNKGRLLFLSMTGGGSSPLVRAEDQTEDAVEDLAEGEDDPDADPDAEATVESDDPPGEGAGDDSTVAETDKVCRIDKNLKIYLFF